MIKMTAPQKDPPTANSYQPIPTEATLLLPLADAPDPREEGQAIRNHDKTSQGEVVQAIEKLIEEISGGIGWVILCLLAIFIVLVKILDKMSVTG